MSQKIKTQQFDVLTGMRGIGVVMVVWFHFWQQSWISPNFLFFGKRVSLDFIPAVGFMGVEIFIVIGAFGLFYPFVKQMFTGSPVRSWGDFAYRRFIRIVPSFYLMIILVCILGQGTIMMRGKDAWHIARHFMFINNLFPDTLLGSINSVSWFIGMQIQFYLIFPLLVMAFKKKPLLTYAILQVGSIIYRNYVFFYQHDQLSYLFNQLPGYLDMYANGMLAAYIIGYITYRVKKEDTSLIKQSSNWLVNFIKRIDKMKLFFTVLAVLSVWFYIEMMKYLDSNRYVDLQGYQLLTRPYFGWALLFIVVSSVFAYKGWKVILSNPITRFMALISYNLFLWHQWISVQIRIRGIIPSVMENPQTDPAWQGPYMLTICALSLGAALITTFLFELPITRFKLKELRKYKAHGLTDEYIIKRVFLGKKVPLPETQNKEELV